MHTLSQETQYVQNPALGAMLLWRFTVGYERGSGTASPTPIPLLFLVLPISLHEDTAHLVNSTQETSGLRAFAGKFSESKISKSDLLLSIHKSSLEMRRLTMDSLALATASSLIFFDCSAGTAISLSSSRVKAGIPSSVRSMLRGAEKFGVWCSTISLHEVSVILKVGF
jgi:hypothetical protein